MHKLIQKILLGMLSGLILSILCMSECKAAVTYTNNSNGYVVRIDDEEDLLTDEEESQLSDQMQAVTAYGNAAFVTVRQTNVLTKDFARSYYSQNFGKQSGIVFVIDMGQRNIWIHSDSAIYRTVTRAYADTITDNVYTYASEERYYWCASTAFEQITALLKGQKIAQPMKHICNALLAVIIALLVNYFIVMQASRKKKPSRKQSLKNIEYHCDVSNLSTKKIRTTKKYSPVSSDSGGSSGGSSGGGGGSSGGGGGHSF